MIVIDPGHGGSDPGAVGPFMEKDMVLQISKYQYDRFKELGIPVKMTRYGDETLNSNERAKRALNAFGNRDDVVIISNHINAGGGKGAEIIHAFRNSDKLSKSIAKELSKSGKNVRKIFTRESGKVPGRDFYYMHWKTGRTEPVIVEYGFIDNPGEASDLEQNWKVYAESVVKAVAEEKGYKYTPPKASIDKKSEEAILMHQVKDGESVFKIAQKYNVSVDSIIRSNNMNDTTLRIGQKLKIPIKGFLYKIKEGDSLYSIAQKFGTTSAKIKKSNNLLTNVLRPGKVIAIPK